MLLVGALAGALCWGKHLDDLEVRNDLPVPIRVADSVGGVRNPFRRELGIVPAHGVRRFRAEAGYGGNALDAITFARVESSESARREGFRLHVMPESNSYGGNVLWRMIIAPTRG